jgi:hypothetical protein
MMLKHDDLVAEFEKLKASIRDNDEPAGMLAALAIAASLCHAVHAAALSLQLISHNTEK